MLQMRNIELEISNPCNEHCVHCYRHFLNLKRDFMSEDMAFSVIKQAKDLGASNAVVTGGEVLLNPQWKQICKTIDAFDLRLSILTNGSLMTEDDADFLSTLKNLRQVQLSLYAVDEMIHDKITGLKGSCEKTKKAIKMLRDRNIKIFVSCPAMKENKNHFAEVMRKMNSEEIDNCVDLMIFSSSDYEGNNMDHCLTEQNIKDFFSEAMKNNGELSYIFKKSKTTDLRQIDFYGGATESLCIGADGTIYPMIGWYESLGNINDFSLKDVFYENQLLKKLRTIKAMDISECASCSSSDFCGFCPTTHLTANHGELYKLNKNYCNYVHLIKKLADQRDEILRSQNSRR